MKIRLKRYNDFMVADGDESIESIQALKPDHVMECSYKIDRNPLNHRRFFKFLGIAFDSQDHFDNKDEFRYWLVGAAGYYDRVKVPNGNVIYKPKSLSFGKMDEDEFRKLFNKAIDAYLKEFNNLTKAQIYAIVDFI